jgi:hypothetical protein
VGVGVGIDLQFRSFREAADADDVIDRAAAAPELARVRCPGGLCSVPSWSGVHGVRARVEAGHLGL